jgi:hypothetical protein
MLAREIRSGRPATGIDQPMRNGMTNTRSRLVALLCIGAAGLAAGAAEPAAPAAAAPASPPATQSRPDEELDQIVVRGESIIKAINDAEDNFYDLFNKVNTDDDYDTQCVYLELSPTSRIASRVCIPGFMADAMEDQVTFAAQCLPPFSDFDANGNGRISREEAQGNPDLYSLFFTLDASRDGNLVAGEYLEWARWSAAGCFHPPPPQLVLMERSKQWAVEMMKVINSDPRLKEQAGHLDDLYRELRQVQTKYTKVREDGLPEHTTRRELGPRAR